MALVYVIRSYVGETLTIGERTIRPWCFIEVPSGDMTPELREQIRAMGHGLEGAMPADL